MRLAMKDLEIRGAGDILGVQQSGHVSHVGYHLYSRLLKKAVDAISQSRPVRFTETRIEGEIDARIPDNYINDTTLKLEIYHRFGEAASLGAIDALLEELKDRFGAAPTPLLWLYYLTRIRYTLSSYGFTLVKLHRHVIEVECLIKDKIVKRTLIGVQVKQPKDLETLLLPRILQAYLER